MYKKSMIVNVGGYEMQLYTISYVAKTLHISAETLRAWERNHIMPKAMFKYKNGVRLYHIKEVEAIAKVLRKKHFRGTYKKQEKLKQALWKELGEARQQILKESQYEKEKEQSQV